MKIYVLSGDISQVGADALITAINSAAMWFGGIDGVISRVAGNMFHDQVNKQLPLEQNETIIARKTHDHHGQFENVVFVIDDLKSPLRNVIKSGLDAASDAGFKNVTLPTIRMGVMLGAVESTKEEALEEMIQGIRLHEETGSVIEHLTFVIYNDSNVHRMLKEMLAVE